MYSHEINSMVNYLMDKQVIHPSNSSFAKKFLISYWRDKIALVWTIEDILDYARQENISCSKVKARAVLKSILKDHDAESGVSWATIHSYLE